MSLDDFSTITVSTNAPALSQVGFGTLLIATHTTLFTERTQVVTSLDDVTALGFTTNSRAYKAVNRAFQQNPRPASVKIGRCDNPATVVLRLTPIVLNAKEYAITIEREGKTPTTVSYTSDSSATATEITTGLKTAIDALTGGGQVFDGVTTTSSPTTFLDLTAPVDVGLWLSAWRSDRLTIEDRTPDPGIAADLGLIRAEDDDWYGLGLADTNSTATANAAAAYIETLRKVAAFNTSDSKAYDSGDTTDMQSVFAAASYARSLAIFDLDRTDGFAGIAALANLFPFDPGQGPYAGGVLNGRTLGGVTPDKLNPTQKANLEAKGYSLYVTTAKINHVLGGRSAAGEWIDFTRFVDWFVTRLQEGLAQLQFNNRRVPYTDVGISMVQSVGEAMIKAGLKAGGIANPDANGNPPSLVMPKLSDTTSTDRSNRILGGGGMQIGFEYAGAIQKVPVLLTATE